MRDAGSQLEDRLAEALVARMLEVLAPLFQERATPTLGTLIDAATLACELGVSRQFVYAHAEELGVFRLGSGRRPRLRFDAETAKRACRQIVDREQPGGRVLVRNSRRAPHAVELLPVRGRPA